MDDEPLVFHAAKLRNIVVCCEVWKNETKSTVSDETSAIFSDLCPRNDS